MQQDPDPSWIAYQSQMNEDNLRTLVILYRVYGGLLAVGACFIGVLIFDRRPKMRLRLLSASLLEAPGALRF
jgi:hypothetical protein